jgi:PiT family inorganic phosphate transporter
MFGLDPTLTTFLIICIIAACAFEFVNGFHDTANAVATVIYTHTLKPKVAVVWSGIWNFIGVIRGGIDVAMGIVILLPLEALADQSAMFSVSMVLALLLGAIIWNLYTWYYGIPCSSSHTLIGAILGVGLVFQYFLKETGSASVNWSKAGDIGLSLLISPIVGLLGALILMVIALKFIDNKKIFEEPEKGRRPPYWIRGILVATCTGVSYAHGNNDGQKGVGLVMVILIALAPMQFALNMDSDIRKSSIDMQDLISVSAKVNESLLDTKSKVKWDEINVKLSECEKILSSVERTEQISLSDKLILRANITSISKNFKKMIAEDKLPLTKDDKKQIALSLDNLKDLTDYAPFWVILLISFSLGIGTMIGWKRIVVTIGEKIGKSHLTYAQGATAELVAAGTIYGASSLGLPVSTTQVLTSAVAGSMVAKEGFKNLQPSTLKSIFIAWVLTFPVSMILSGGLFWLLVKILVQ